MSVSCDAYVTLWVSLHCSHTWKVTLIKYHRRHNLQTSVYTFKRFVCYITWFLPSLCWLTDSWLPLVPTERPIFRNDIEIVSDQYSFDGFKF